ncbi:MAG: nucleoside kinase [Clostridia bacterium]|nr:nucleoside kinase [Clostridia bacterium]
MKITLDKKTITVPEGSTVGSVLDTEVVLLAELNNGFSDVDAHLAEGDVLETYDASTREGYVIYKQTLIHVLSRAVKKLFPKRRLCVRQSVNKSTYFEILPQVESCEENAAKLYEAMAQIIKAGEKCEMQGKYYMCASNTAAVAVFDVIAYDGGFLLRYPNRYSGGKIPPVQESLRLHKILVSNREWNEKVAVGSVSELNEAIRKGTIKDVINLAEGLAEKRIIQIADEIASRRDVRIVLVAGPSGSGKTSFSSRLRMHLRINGIKTELISMDNYFKDARTLFDGDGKRDFESVEALDYELLSRHLSELIRGEEIQMPIFDFVNARRSSETIPMKVAREEIIIMEGIHALNEKTTLLVEKGNKYKVYCGAFSSIAFDDENIISATDVRLIRRLVRDAAFRNADADYTFELWEDVRESEYTNIFPFENEADDVFNSALVYELAAMKHSAQALLSRVSKESPYHLTALRLLRLLSFFEPMDTVPIPPTSVVREFIGGSTIID